MPENIEPEIFSRFRRRRFIFMLVDLHEVPFDLFDAFFAAKPAKKPERVFGRCYQLNEIFGICA